MKLKLVFKIKNGNFIEKTIDLVDYTTDEGQTSFCDLKYYGSQWLGPNKISLMFLTSQDVLLRKTIVFDTMVPDPPKSKWTTFSGAYLVGFVYPDSTGPWKWEDTMNASSC